MEHRISDIQGVTVIVHTATKVVDGWPAESGYTFTSDIAVELLNVDTAT